MSNKIVIARNLGQEVGTTIIFPRREQGLVRQDSRLQREKIVRVQINTDGNIGGRNRMTDQVKDSVERALKRMSDHIIRVEVHLSDVNGRKQGANDMGAFPSLQ